MSMAVVFCDVASEPASGSLKQNAPMISPVAKRLRYFSFCSGVPNFSRPQHTSELFTLMHTEAEASIFEISSMAKTYEMVSIPLPWYSGETIIPISPSSPILRIPSAGNFWWSSRSITPGSSSVCAKSRAAC